MTNKYHTLIIGAGTAGLSARREVSKLTDNYLVIDDGPLGTTCARIGCMPSKVLIQAANDFHRRHKFDTLGITGSDGLGIDHFKTMAHVRGLRDYFVGFVKEGIGKWADDHLIRKRATFIDANTLDLGDERVQADNIIIASGSSPVIPGSWRQYSDHLITTDDFFELETLPKRVAVVGLGVIGIELGQALSRLGVEVVGLSLGKAIGGLSDPELQDYAADTFSQEFETVFAAAEIFSVSDAGIVVGAGDKQWTVDKILLTLGRSPNLNSLNLSATGANLNERGVPEIDQETLRIKGTPIYLAGDATGERNLLHEAADEGRIAGYNAVRGDDHCFRRRPLLAVTFSDPNIAIVGKSWRELSNSDKAFVTGSASYESQGRATVMLKDKGQVHVYADRASGVFLGAEMIAPGAEHFAHLLSWIVTMGISVHEVLSLPFYHPVLEEGLRTAFRDAASKVDAKPADIELLRCSEPPVGARTDKSLNEFQSSTTDA
ncbi:MAG: dihydrolipoyl dehydrogenase [Methylococcales bacterium]|nr:dihydrolipoyl dehydrogenase [Methylococcales bacterium]